MIFIRKEQELYSSLQKAGFIVVFRKHTELLKGKKKGNVDVDIVFEAMKRVIEKNDKTHNKTFNKIVLVSGDGDYIKLVNYLMSKKLFKKILFPNKQHSSLYNKIQRNFGINLGIDDIKKKVIYKKRGALRDLARLVPLSW